MEFEEVALEDVMVPGEKKRKKSHPYIPRAWRWAGVKQATNKRQCDRHGEGVQFFTCMFILLEGPLHSDSSLSATRRSCCLVGTFWIIWL